jgi:hypothetical protein
LIDGDAWWIWEEVDMDRGADQDASGDRGKEWAEGYQDGDEALVTEEPRWWFRSRCSCRHV